MSPDFLEYPPSFDYNLLANSFHANNGEIGVLPLDVPEFLTACKRDAIAILGWEMWLADYFAGLEVNPIPQKGSWCGIIPIKGESVPCVFSGDTKARQPYESWNEYVSRTVKETQEQIHKVNIEEEVEKQYISFVRFNFTLAEK